MSNRLIQINKQLQQEISSFLQISAPELFVSVTRVQVTPDLKDASVWLSFINDPENGISRIRSLVRDLAGHLFERLSIKHIPHLHFKLDEGLEYSEHISSIIQDIKSNNKS